MKPRSLFELVALLGMCADWRNVQAVLGRSSSSCSSGAERAHSALPSTPKQHQHHQQPQHQQQRQQQQQQLLKLPQFGEALGKTKSCEEHSCPSLKSSSGTHQLALMESVNTNVLRGVRHERVLDRFGHIWKSVGGTLSVTETDFEQSEIVDRLHTFVSHDWATSGYKKFAVLCLHHNGNGALAVGIAVASVALVMECAGISPRVPYHPFIIESYGYDDVVSFGVTIIFVPSLATFIACLRWHSWRKVFGRPSRMLFVDKVCINQVDEDLKSQGIQGIAAFIKHSDNLMILWSPRVFTRLWCTYEVVSWAHFDKDPDKIHFLPTAYGYIVPMLFTFVWLGFTCRAVFHLLVDLTWQIEGFALLWITIMNLAAIPACRYIAEEQRILVNTHEQLTSFCIQQASCFCCSVGHRHPFTQEEISCDRLRIEKTLSCWREGVDATTSQHLDFFNRRVRTILADQAHVLAKGAARLPLTYSSLAFFPFWCWVLDAIPENLKEPIEVLTAVLLARICVVSMVVPTALAASMDILASHFLGRNDTIRALVSLNGLALWIGVQGLILGDYFACQRHRHPALAVWMLTNFCVFLLFVTRRPKPAKPSTE